MNRASFAGEQQARMFCRPIYTGIGEVAVRPILPADASLARAFIGSLSTTSRYFRFFQALKGLPPAMLERFIRVDHITQIALVGIAFVDGEQRMVGEARCALNPDGTSADIAVAVADRWQRHGIATGLVGMLERIAGATGIARLTGETFAVNQAFLDFARTFGFRVSPDPADRSFLRIEKPIVASSGRAL